MITYSINFKQIIERHYVIHLNHDEILLFIQLSPR
jgi:hypothetical protein